MNIIKIIPLNEFKRNYKNLKKRFRKIDDDIKDLTNSLIKEPKQGDHLGDGIYKIRIKNSSNNRGKSGGYRVITYYYG